MDPDQTGHSEGSEGAIREIRHRFDPNRLRVPLIAVSAVTLALAAAFLVLGSVFYWGNVIIFGSRKRGACLFLFTIAFLVPGAWGLAWLGCRAKRCPEGRKMTISLVFLILSSSAVVLGIVELGFFIAMAVPGSYGPVYVLKQDGVQTHWRGTSTIELESGE